LTYNAFAKSPSTGEPAGAKPDGEIDRLAGEINRLGEELGLPCIAVSADIGSPSPMLGSDGRPFAETVFTWLDPDTEYWKDRTFALRAAFVHAARTCAEPFCFDGERFFSWRDHPALEEANAGSDFPTFGVRAAIVAPIHLPGGTIGAVVWATGEPVNNLASLFEAHAATLFCLAQRFIATYADRSGSISPVPAVRLTPREIQCLKHAAAGRSDIEISRAIDVSVPTVRFHLTNAARKIGASGRSQTVHYATRMGYIGNACKPARPAG